MSALPDTPYRRILHRLVDEFEDEPGWSLAVIASQVVQQDLELVGLDMTVAELQRRQAIAERALALHGDPGLITTPMDDEHALLDCITNGTEDA